MVHSSFKPAFQGILFLVGLGLSCLGTVNSRPSQPGEQSELHLLSGVLSTMTPFLSQVFVLCLDNGLIWGFSVVCSHPKQKLSITQ